MNVRVYSADSRDRVQAYGLAIKVQNDILDRMTKMMNEMLVLGKNTLLPFQKGKLFYVNVLLLKIIIIFYRNYSIKYRIKIVVRRYETTFQF